jgi:DNA replicative helicase MCM subunit Mcm2 (Cdc46/Mcm family)
MVFSSQPSQASQRNTTHLLEQLTAFLLSHHRQDIIDVLAAIDVDDERHHSVTCSLTELGAWNAEVASRVVNDAAECMDVFDTALLSVQNQIVGQLQDASLTVKQHIHARLFAPPGFSSATQSSMTPSPVSSVRSELLNSLITISGTVAKTGVVNVLESRKTFECTSCGYRFAVVVDDLTNDVSLPKECPSTNASCAADTFRESQVRAEPA